MSTEEDREALDGAVSRLSRYVNAGSIIHTASSYRTSDGTVHVIEFDDLRTVLDAARRPVQGEYEAGYAEGFHDGLSTPRGTAEDDRTPAPAPDVQELIAEAREWPRDGINEGRLINTLADALEAAEKELAMRRSESADFERERDEAVAAHDAEVRAAAWDEGFSRGFYAGQSYPDGADASEPDIDNPYRKEQENNNA